MTCSVGVALYSGDSALTPEMMIERADAAMFRSKRAGKNQSTTVEDSPGDS